VMGQKGSELDSSSKQQEHFRSLRWCSKDWFEKLYLFFYIRYTRRQERQTPEFQRLHPLMERLPLDDPMRKQFRQESLPLMPLCNIITFDTRVCVLFLSLIVGHPWIYFVFEATVLEAVRYYARHRHESFCHKFYQTLSAV